MNYRQASLLAEEDASTAATKTIDLDIKDVISRIQVKYGFTNGSHDATDHPAKIISKVEIVDGSTVLYSLSGREIEALDFFDGRRVRPYELEYRSGCPGFELLNLNFGRKLYDPLLAFDPKKFSNPQIKVSHNKALGGSAPSSSTLEIVADVFDQKAVTPQGYLMSKEHETATLVANAYVNVDLPTDHVMRKLLVMVRTAGYELDNQLSTIKLSEDNDKRVIIDANIDDYFQEIDNLFGPYREQMVGTFSGVASHGWYCTPISHSELHVRPIGGATVALDAEFGGGYFTMTPSGVTAWRGGVQGFEPHGAVPVLCGDQDEIADWYDVTKVGALKLRLKAASGPSGSVEVVTQQLRKYA